MEYLKAKKQFEQYFLLTTLMRHKWKVAEAADNIGLSRQGLFKLIKKYDLKPDSRLPVPSLFITSENLKLNPLRRVVLFDPHDIVWLKSKSHLGSYSELLRRALRLLKKLPDSKIKTL